MLPPSSTPANTAVAASATYITDHLSAPDVGVWTEEEHQRFHEAVEKYPNGPWSAVAAFVGTRTVRQTMTHAQKCRQRLDRHGRGLLPAGRQRRASQSNNGSASVGSPEPSSLSGAFGSVDIAEPQALVGSPGPIDESKFDRVL